MASAGAATEDECCICLGEISQGDLAEAPCGHKFCRECILKTLGMKPPEWSGGCPLCRAHISVYNLRNTQGTCMMTPDVHSLYGCVFVQQGGIGVASYHFDAEDECYISYANAPRGWRLDDGSRPPAKKPWTNVRYDPLKLTFHGTVEWDPPFGGCVRWIYRIVFAEDFIGVIGGEVQSFTADGTSETQDFRAPWEDFWDPHLAYLRWTPPSETLFGTTFVQGTMYHFLLEGIASYHFDSLDDCYISYANAPSEWRLGDGSAPPIKKHFCNTSYDERTKTFRGSVEWDPPFDGASRWEYTITFADDFSRVRDGSMQPYSATGRRQPLKKFGDPSLGVLFPGEKLYYVQKPPVLAMTGKLRAQLKVNTQSPTEEEASTPTPEMPSAGQRSNEPETVQESRFAGRRWFHVAFAAVAVLMHQVVTQLRQ